MFAGLILWACAAMGSAATAPVLPMPAAPHHGNLLRLGKSFAYVEFVLDPTKGELTLYVLDAQAENPIRLAQEAVRVSGTAVGHPFTVKMDAVDVPETGEKKWDTSVFRGETKDLVGVDHFDGAIFFIRIKGNNFSKTRFKYVGDTKETTQD